MLRGYVPHQVVACRQALRSRGGVFGGCAEGVGDPHEFTDWAALLGKRTAEMHRALASSGDQAAFRPEPTSMLDARSVYQSLRSLASQVFQILRREQAALPEWLQSEARLVLEVEAEVLERVRAILNRPVSVSRIRCHGDFHLGQVLFTGLDYVIVDFEGEPARSLEERRLKRWAYKDVAGMMRSYEYAAFSAIGEKRELQTNALQWAEATSSAFLASYQQSAAGAGFASPDPEEARLLLETMLIEKALYELRYELNNRPGWVGIPLRGLLRMTGVSP